MRLNEKSACFYLVSTLATDITSSSSDLSRNTHLFALIHFILFFDVVVKGLELVQIVIGSNLISVTL